MPLISIITPCFNDGIYLDDAFKSIEFNKYEDIFEHIIINDGSTDEFTLKKIDDLQNKGAIVIHQKNKGLAEARNAGIKIAKGKYILPLDSDNKIVPEVFLELSELLECDETIDVAHTFAYYFGEKEGIWELSDFNMERMIVENHIDACTLIRKSTIEKVKLYSTDMPVMGHEDWDLWIKIGFAGGNFSLLRKPGFFYRVSNESMVNTISSPNVTKTLSYIFKKYHREIRQLYGDSYSYKVLYENSSIISKNNEKDSNRSATVVVPIYKNFQELDQSEITSLNQCLKIFCTKPICLIGPPTIKWSQYITYFNRESKTVEVKIFDSGFFTSLKGYNKLMISIEFYKRFNDFKYILIYQLDAYVLKDELNYWCEKGYDYIGAPWSGIHSYEGKRLLGVGNGGFSLRNLRSSIKLLKELRVIEILEEYESFNWKGIIPRLPVIIKSILTAKIPSKFESNYSYQEDVFWCIAAPNRVNNFSSNSIILQFLAKCFVKKIFKIAPESIASKFSFETKAAELYELNNRKLPFGCHAWEKYEPEFWKRFISIPTKDLA
jgi:glycosyltransferase involved in cell wall biosynthesis